MNKILAFCLALTLGAAARPPEMKTHTMLAPKARLTVLHYEASWCPDCVAMEPAWTEFETAFRGRVNLVTINKDDKSSPEFKRYTGNKDIHEIPVTFWLDESGKVLHVQRMGMKASELKTVTERFLKR